MRYDLEECKNNDALEKMRGFYTKSVLKMNRNLRKPLSGTQIRKKISEEAELTEREKAILYKKKSMKNMSAVSKRADRKLKNKNCEKLSDRLPFL